MQKKQIMLVKPNEIKNLEEKEVQEYIRYAVLCYPIEKIAKEINSVLAPEVEKITEEEIARTYIAMQEISRNEVTQEQARKMTLMYLNKDSAYKSNYYMWLRQMAQNITELAFEDKEPSLYGVSANIFRKYGKVVPIKCIDNHFRKIGLIFPLGSKKEAIKKAGINFKNKLNNVERRYKGKKKQKTGGK